MTVKCSKVKIGDTYFKIVQWPVKGSLLDYDKFIDKVKQLERKDDTLLIVSPVEFHPLQCLSAFIHAIDSFRLGKNKMKTIDLQALSILYGESQIKRLFKSIRGQVIERGFFNVCIIHAGEHPGTRFLPKPPEPPKECGEPTLDQEALESLVNVVRNYLNML